MLSSQDAAFDCFNEQSDVSLQSGVNDKDSSKKKWEKVVRATGEGTRWLATAQRLAVNHYVSGPETLRPGV
jgi:hypothetical protein